MPRDPVGAGRASGPFEPTERGIGSLSVISRKRLAQLVSWLVAAALLAWAFGRVDRVETWKALTGLGLWEGSTLVAINLVALAVFALRWWVILLGMGQAVSLWSLTGYRVAAFGLSYFTPGPQVGGEPLQVLLLERRHGVDRATAIASVGLEQAIGFFVNFSMLAVAVSWLIADGGFADRLALAGVITVVVLVLAPAIYLLMLLMDLRPASACVAGAARLLGGHRGSPRLARAREILARSEGLASHFCRARRRHFALALGASTLSWVLILGEYALLARFLGSTLTLWQLLLGVVSKRLSYLLLLPSAIGAFEAGQVWAWGEMGLSRSVGMSASLVIRLRDTAVGAFGLLWGLKKLRLGTARAGSAPPSILGPT